MVNMATWPNKTKWSDNFTRESPETTNCVLFFCLHKTDTCNELIKSFFFFFFFFNKKCNESKKVLGWPPFISPTSLYPLSYLTNFFSM